MQTRTTRWLAAPALVAMVMASGGAIYAQNNGGPGGGPGGPGQGGQGGPGGGRGNFANMTPEQREQMMAQMREQGVRRSLAQNNIASQEVADSVVEFVNAQAAATQLLQERARALNEALRSPDSTNEQITPLLAAFREAVAAEKTRRETALKDLDNSIGYSKNSRLEAALTMGGYIGDEASVLNAGAGGMGGGRGRFGGQGGRGGGQGGFGGPGGGPGGQGGPGGGPGGPNG